MKLRDPDSIALVDAYRAHTRPSPEARQRMARVLGEANADERRVWPWIVAGGVAAAAVVLWLVVSLVGGPLRMTARSNPSTAADQALPNGSVRPASDGPQTRAPNIDPPPLPRASATPAAAPPKSAVPSPAPARTRSDRAELPSTPERAEAADEWLRIEAAERALAKGKPSLALYELDRHAREFPRADLRQEQRALRVLALCAVGRTTEGRGQQGAFLRDFPRSTYRARVEQACTP